MTHEYTRTSSRRPGRFLRKPEAMAELGIRANSTWYTHIANGLIPPPVKLGARASAWIEDEILTVKYGRIAGMTNDEVRDLVEDLVSGRADWCKRMAAEDTGAGYV